MTSNKFALALAGMIFSVGALLAIASLPLHLLGVIAHSDFHNMLAVGAIGAALACFALVIADVHQQHRAGTL